MSACPRRPSFRYLDIYRLVVARGFTQRQAARSFGVTPARICQVVRRVRRWVDQSIGDWLLPREHRIRFYVALHCEHIRPYELEADPETVLLVGPGWSYSRQHRIEAESNGQPPVSASSPRVCDAGSPRVSEPADRSTEALPDTSNDPLQPPPKADPQLTAKDISAMGAAQAAPPDATPCGSVDSVWPAITELAHRLAELLILSKKTKKFRPCRAMTNDQ
jgi:hypothetical protein